MSDKEQICLKKIEAEKSLHKSTCEAELLEKRKSKVF